VSLAKSATAQARAAARACGDLRITTTFANHNDNASNDNGSNDNGVTLRSDLRCTDDQKDVLDAAADGLEGYQLAPAALLSQLTELCCNERLQTIVQGLKSALDIATARLQKVKTGGNDDAARLDLFARAALSTRDCRSALVAIAGLGAPLPPSPPPFAWSDPDPCAIDQLPGKIPPFLEQDVRPVQAVSLIQAPISSLPRQGRLTRHD
jgi:hypothetical protein